MKKNRFAIILLAVLAIVTLVLVLTKNSKSTMDNADSVFAISDTASVTRIFLSDKSNNSVTLKRRENGGWSLNDSLNASSYAINIFLKTISSVEVKSPVAKNAYNQIISLLATSSVKVEIYQKAYRLNIFGLKLFPHEKRTRTYYVGTATQDNLGTYMMIEGADIPYITYIPGFNGFLSSRYSPLLKDWRDHLMFSYKYRDLASVQIEYPENPAFSFTITKSGNRDFSLKTAAGTISSGIDTTIAMEYFSSFQNIRYEELLNDISIHAKDSVISTIPWQIITLTDSKGGQFIMKTFKKGAPGEFDIEGNPVDIDRDRLYALFNNGKDFVLIQYYVFLNIFRKADDFLIEKQNVKKE